MTGHPYPPAGHLTPWQMYLNMEHAARNEYLQAVQDAHAEYLTGPWPDRDAYTICERRAWITYYAAGRAAWKHYTSHLSAGNSQQLTSTTAPPSPAGNQAPDEPRGSRPPAAPYLYPVPGGTGWPGASHQLTAPAAHDTDGDQWPWHNN